MASAGIDTASASQEASTGHATAAPTTSTVAAAPAATVRIWWGDRATSGVGCIDTIRSERALSVYRTHEPSGPWHPPGYTLRHDSKGKYLRARSRQNCGELRTADAALVPRARGVRLPQQGFHHPWRAALYVEGNLRPLPAPGVGAREARHRR